MLTTPPREKNIIKKYSQGEMLPLETKQAGGKLLPHSDLRGGVFLGDVSRSRKRDGENYIRRSLRIFTPYPILYGW